MNDISRAKNMFPMEWARFTWKQLLACVIFSNSAIGATVVASECNGRADALGVSRVIAVDPLEHSRVGTMQYPETLPLGDHEVVPTFDDGPSPRYTDRILATLASACVRRS
jgi:hypothetical protein